jgi:DNA replication protein DnaC
VKPSDDDLDALLKRLHLANARRIWPKLVERAEREEWSYRDFLTLLATEEIAQRQQTRLGRLSRWASFPFLKTIDDFDFTFQSTVRLALLGSALSPDFVTEGRCLILLGKPGRGKTHLAVALAYRAIQNGFDALFTTAAELIDDLSAAFREGRLAEALTTYTHPAVLVVDEVGYLTYGTDAANMLFHVVNERHRRKRSMIFTTNKPPAAWGKVLHDEDLGQAIVDRVLERGRLLTLDGPSMRTRHLGLDEVSPEASNHPADNLARISGIARPEFPEPPAQSAYMTLEQMQVTRVDQAMWGQSAYGTQYDVSTPAGALQALPFGLVYLLFAPFPWAISGFRQLLTLPETLVWYALMPAFARGFVYSVRHRLRDVLPILVFAVTLTSAGNAGAIRAGAGHRAGRKRISRPRGQRFRL